MECPDLFPVTFIIGLAMTCLGFWLMPMVGPVGKEAILVLVGAPVGMFGFTGIMMWLASYR